VTEDKKIDRDNKAFHTVHREEIIPGVTLTCITTDKFKTGCITINLISKLSEKTAALNALLPRVLRRGSGALPDMERISAALDELYGARIEPLLRKKGELHCVGLFTDFPDDRYIPGGQSVLEQAALLLGQMLISPNMKDGLFREDYVQSEKANLIDDIRAAINDKRGYAVDRLLEEMCADEAYGINKLGGEKEAAAITAASLTAQYKKLISESKIEVLYCGSAESQRVKKAIIAALHGLNARENAALPETQIILKPKSSAPVRVTEKLDVSQGKLTVGFRLGKAMETPDYPALIVFNSVYGGSITSKLFLNVRERLSLCYYASSMLDKHKGVMLVSSGVEFENFETALNEILFQLQEVKDGKITEWELVSAKRYVITSIMSGLDRLGGLEELYFDCRVSKVPYDPIDICGKVYEISLERVVSIASGAEPDMVYFLTGEGGGGNDA